MPKNLMFKLLLLASFSAIVLSQSSEDVKVPTMKMYFHGGINDYMMFQSWVPQTQGSYWGAWVLFCFLGILLEGFLVYGHNVTTRWSKELNAKGISTDPVAMNASFFAPSKDITWYKAFVLSAFRFLESTLAYFLMLVTMIYNVGLFFSVITGHALGVFLFSRFRAKSTEAMVESDPQHAGITSTSPIIGQPSLERGDSNDKLVYELPAETSGSCH